MTFKSDEEQGRKVRRQVLGDRHVDRSASSDPIARLFQDYAHQVCYGTLWTRPQLPLQMRSYVCLSIISALARPAELKTHIRGALNLGITREQIAEVFLHTAMYAGAPAGSEAFRCALEVFEEVDREGK